MNAPGLRGGKPRITDSRQVLCFRVWHHHQKCPAHPGLTTASGPPGRCENARDETRRDAPAGPGRVSVGPRAGNPIGADHRVRVSAMPALHIPRRLIPRGVSRELREPGGCASGVMHAVQRVQRAATAARPAGLPDQQQQATRPLGKTKVARRRVSIMPASGRPQAVNSSTRALSVPSGAPPAPWLARAGPPLGSSGSPRSRVRYHSRA